MSILVVGSVAYDTVETPFGRASSTNVTCWTLHCRLRHFSNVFALRSSSFVRSSTSESTDCSKSLHMDSRSTKSICPGSTIFQ